MGLCTSIIGRIRFLSKKKCNLCGEELGHRKDVVLDRGCRRVIYKHLYCLLVAEGHVKDKKHFLVIEKYQTERQGGLVEATA